MAIEEHRLIVAVSGFHHLMTCFITFPYYALMDYTGVHQEKSVKGQFIICIPRCILLYNAIVSYKVMQILEIEYLGHYSEKFKCY
jgi:hypothetical protein